MSDYPHQFGSAKCYSSKLYICLFSTQQHFFDSVTNLLSSDRYELKCLNLARDLIDFVINNKEQIDCIVLVTDIETSWIVKQLWQLEVLLPTVIVEVEQPDRAFTRLETDLENSSNNNNIGSADIVDHQAQIRLYPTQLAEINSYISLAIAKFLSLTPSCHLSDRPKQKNELEESNSLVTRQRRLIEKLQQRLEYLGVYRQRNSSYFYRNLSLEKQGKLEQELNQSYRQILLKYFDDNSQINKLIDEFVERAFFADISTSQVLEMHMELIDDFSYQLKIENRNDDILLDYRLPLIDVVAHLCEMYRRSIPREELSIELLFTIEQATSPPPNS